MSRYMRILLSYKILIVVVVKVLSPLFNTHVFKMTIIYVCGCTYVPFDRLEGTLHLNGYLTGCFLQVEIATAPYNERDAYRTSATTSS